MKVHKDEKKGTYWFVASAGKDANGKRQQIKRRGFKTEKEAMREMRKLLQQVDDNIYIKNTKLKYVDFLKGEWLDSKALKLRIVTLGTYKHNITKHIAPYFKKHEIGNITTQMIEKFYAHLSNTSRLSERSIQDIHKIIKSSFKTAVKRKYLSFSPAEEAQAPKVPSKEMMVWDLNETTRFLKASEKHELYIAFELALTTGMRQSEILGLRWKDIDFDEGVLHVRQTLSHDGKKIYQDTKTKSSKRTISLVDRTLDILKDQRKKYKKLKLAAGSDFQDYDLVICTKRGTPINPRNLLRSFYSLMKKAEVPKIRFHDLRHTVATLMLSRNINPKVVKEILGHSDIRVTLDTYSHVLPSVHKETAKKFGSMLFG
ncbi:site-specific integrase [Paenibacillus oenotherae]|uniref:Site-specific integrase n=1 Tax=Paenibacillus oenotherae TaxID=1435645 RepID=A0ABS7D9P7_9BACL|nr:tyrosine-type recombinase/integrase [Paenibacillus oenotherae]MBW7476669.1 site-specific integrase [Paenibacillus oenotherae]